MAARSTNLTRRSGRYGSGYGKNRRYKSRYGKSSYRMRSKRRSYRSRYPRRNTYRKRSNYTSNAATRELAVYVNPYSVKTQQPRIPDGSRHHSLGVSLRSHITLSSTVQAGYVILYAAASSFGAVLTSAGAYTSATENYALDPDPIINATGLTNTVEGWRGVSFGLKLRNANNMLSNDGTWQAIRIRPCEFQNFTIGDSQISRPELTTAPALATWANDPSFSSGRLKDLHKKDFILATEQDEHLWRRDNEGDVYGDPSFDIIMIYLSNMLNITADFYGNYERTYKSGDLNRYQLKTNQVMPSTLARYQMMKRKKCTRAAS